VGQLPCRLAEDSLREGKNATIRIEILCDDNLYIWSVFCGSPGSRNDITRLNTSPLLRAIRTRKWPSRRPDPVMIDQMQCDWYYFPVDGIFPRYRVWISSISAPKDLKGKTVAKQHEGIRKSVERVFGVFFKRFRMLALPCRLWFKEDMVATVQACCIIHNMIVRARRSTYTGTRMRIGFDAGGEEEGE
jgi:hypothetical protein